MWLEVFRHRPAIRACLVHGETLDDQRAMVQIRDLSLISQSPRATPPHLKDSAPVRAPAEAEAKLPQAAAGHAPLELSLSQANILSLPRFLFVPALSGPHLLAENASHENPHALVIDEYGAP